MQHEARDHYAESAPGAAYVAATMRPFRIPAWLASACLHASLVIALALFWKVAPIHGVARDEGGRQAGVALVDTRSGAAEYYFSNAGEQAGGAASHAPAGDPLPAASEASAVASNAPGLPTPAEAGGVPGAASGLTGPAGLTGTGRPARGVGGDTTTSVFGAQGTGSRFVYVFDRSASMAAFGGRPLAAAKRELVASLQNLEATHQFQIVFYNDRPSVFNPNAPQPPRLLFADEQGKRLAERFVEGIVASGGTRHWDALQLALDLRPDVIFLLTDGTEEPITASQLARIQRLAERSGTSIQSIEFGQGPVDGSGGFLRRLAVQNHGQYAYVDISRLGP